MSESNFRYIEEQTQADPQRQQPERRLFNLKVDLSAKDVIKMLAIFGGTIATCFLIVFAYLAELMVGVLVLVGMVAFILLIGKVVD